MHSSTAGGSSTKLATSLTMTIMVTPQGSNAR
jgi:hypothetical protein